MTTTYKMARILILLFSAVAALTGCATPGIAPISLPQGQPVRLLFPSEGVNLQVITTPTGGGTSVITKLLSDAVDDANRSNTAKLRELAELQQQREPLGKLFETELRRRLEAKGGKLATDSAGARVPTITLENLTAMYFATAIVSNYEPTAFVYVTSSTDPPTVGNRPGAMVRTVEVKLSQMGYSFGSSSAVFSEPPKAYAGLRNAVVELADRVATAIATAQGERAR